ncbi:helix-turn-helix domain-containing protein [Halosimplex aquaticum]
MTPDDGKTVQTAVTSFEILEGIRELDGAGPTALADHLDRSKSGVYKHVRTLADRGYLVEDGGEYRLGLGMWTLGAGARSEYPVEAGRRTVDSLVASVGHVASLVVYENGVASSVYRERPGADVDTVGSSATRSRCTRRPPGRPCSPTSPTPSVGPSSTSSR